MRALLAIGGWLVFVAGVQALDIRQAPKYKEWILTLQQGTDKQRGAVAAALARYGQGAWPAVAALRVTVRETEAQAPLRQVIAALAAIGPKAREALPDVLERLQSGDVSPRDIVEAVTAFGEPTNKTFLRLCLRHLISMDDWHDDAPLRVQLRRAPETVVPWLLNEAADGDDETRIHVLRTLRYYALDDDPRTRKPRSLPTRDWLRESLKARIARFARTFLLHERPIVRHLAHCLILGMQPVSLDEIFPHYLRTWFGHQNEMSQPSFGMLPVECCRLLIDELASGNAEWRRMILQMLDRLFDEHPLACVPYWRAGLRHHQRRVITQLLGCIVENQTRFRTFQDEVCLLLAHRDANIQIRAVGCLLENEVRLEAMLPILEHFLRRGTPVDRQSALHLLKSMGPMASPLKAIVLRLHRHPSAGVRYDAALALAHIDPRAAGTYLPVFQGIWDHAKGGPPHELLTALAHAGPHARPFLPRLHAAWATVTSTETKMALAAALVRVDEAQARTPLEYLFERLQAEDVGDAICAINTLHRLGSAAKALVPRLLNVDSQRNPNVELLLWQTVVHIDETAVPVVLDRLRALLGHADVVDGWANLSVLGRHAKPLLPDLLRLVQHHPERRATLCRLFGNLGEHAASTMPTLRAWAKDETSQFEAMLALRQIKRSQGGRN